jgi:hypothetical protein
LLVLNYDYGRLLYGTTEVPGGLAGGPGHAERDDWIDTAVPAHASVALVPPPFTNSVGAAERTEFWNRSIDAVLALRFTGVGVPASAGHEVIESPLEEGVAAWHGPAFRWLAGQRDDPRVQFAGTPVGGSRYDPFVVVRLAHPGSAAIWTATGLEPDLYLPPRRRVDMTLARSRARDVRTVVLRLRAPDGVPTRVSWTITSTTGRRLTGRLKAGQEQIARLRVPACSSDGARCSSEVWRLSVHGGAVNVPLAVYGPTVPRPPMALQLLAARLERR